MAIDNTGLVYLLDSFWQGENLNGKPLVGGYMCVYVAGTDTKYITYQNFDGTRNPFKIPLGSDGRAVILVEAQYKYDCYLYDSFGNMVCSRLNVSPDVGGDISVSGLTEVYHDGTLEGEGTPWVPLTVSTSAIDEMVSGKADVSALTAYQEISGMTAYQPAGDYYSASNPSGFATTDYVDSGLSGKADSSALDGLMSASLLESTDGVITAYNGSAFAGGGGSTYSGIAPVIVDNENNTISVSAKEFVVNDPLQLVENPSAFELSLTGSLDNPRIRIVEYGVDDWDTVESAISDMSAGKIDYVVAKMVGGNDIVYAPLARVNSGEQAVFVSPANAQDTSFGMGTRRVTDVISISSGGDWYDRMIKPFQGRIYGYGSVHVQATGSDYEISGDTLPTSAQEAIDLVSTNSATWDTVTSKQPSGDYYSASNPSGFITGVPAGTMNESGFEYSGSSITAYNGSAFKAGDEFPQSATDAINVVTGNSANWNDVSSKLDTTAFSTVSGDFITALPSDLATTGDIADLAESISETYQPKGDYLTANALDNVSGTWSTVTNKLDTTAFSTVSGNFLTAHQSLPESATWNTVTSKLDTTAFSTVSGSFLTAHQELSESANWNSTYNTVSDNSAAWGSGLEYGWHDTAISSINGSALYDTSAHARITTLSNNKLNTTAFSTVSGSFLTALPDSANWDSTYNTVSVNSGSWSGRPQVPVSGINIDIYESDGKVVFSGMTGGDVPEGVMVESGLEYNAVQEISGYNGSAIAQYGAEKQWLVHDDTLVHASNSAQYALGVNLSAVAQLLGIDETVLWEGSANTGTLNFSEPLTSFKEFKFYVYLPERGTNQVLTYYDAVNTVNPGFLQLTMNTMTTGSVVSAWWRGVYNINATVNTATYQSMSIYANGQYYKQCSTTACGTNDSKLVIKKVVGIGRKQ